MIPRRAPQAALCAVLLSLCGCRGKPAVPILTWHSIAEQGDAFTVPPARFAAQLDALQGRNVISMHDFLAGRIPPRPLVLTFDDGAQDAFSVALPELQRRGLRATFFIVTGLVGEDEAHRRTQDGVRYLIWPEVVALARAGMEIGSHSVDHARLPDLPEPRVRDELAFSRRALEQHLRAPVDLFAYPYNSLRGWVARDVAAAGYLAAVAGEAHGSADRFRLYRIGIQRDTTPESLRETLRAWR